MAKLSIQMDCDNAAFRDQDHSFNFDEISRILRETASKIERGNTDITLIDINGNKVGKATITLVD